MRRAIEPSASEDGARGSESADADLSDSRDRASLSWARPRAGFSLSYALL